MDSPKSKRIKLDSSSDEQGLSPWPSENALSSKNPQFGNYSRYYGYRTNDPKADDPRLKCFRQEVFHNKVVLDLGCNAGNVTISIARRFQPKHIYGVDIDPKLIQSANQQLKSLYFKSIDENDKDYKEALAYLKKTVGPLKGFPLPIDLQQSEQFPNNVSFHVSNCVPKPNETEFEASFDCILALSLTKWIHMNFGDSGLKRLFRRIYAQLKDGGVFILEPQTWSSYRKKAKRCEHTCKVFSGLQFRPDMFKEFLLKDVGFRECSVLGIPPNDSKGFQRTIFMFTK